MSTLAWLGVALCLVGGAGLLASEARRSARGIAIWKPLASAGFLLVGLKGGVTLFLLALALSFIGDIGLIRMERPAWFRVGLYSFLLAHVAYVAAFLGAGVSWPTVALSAAALAIPGVLIARWILPRVAEKASVIAYMIVISAMVAFALGTRSPWLIAAAALFYLSDITVARHRFVRTEPLNRLVGLPMYYGAQLLFALYAAAA